MFAKRQQQSFHHNQSSREMNGVTNIRPSVIIFVFECVHVSMNVLLLITVCESDLCSEQKKSSFMLCIRVKHIQHHLYFVISVSFQNEHREKSTK